MKLCKDCKWCEPGTTRGQSYILGILPIPFFDLVPSYNHLSYCNHPNNMRECPVSGEKTRIVDFCIHLRTFDECGTKAIWFEPKTEVEA